MFLFALGDSCYRSFSEFSIPELNQNQNALQMPLVEFSKVLNSKLRNPKKTLTFLGWKGREYMHYVFFQQNFLSE